jgi:hypothetical protein
MKKRTLLLITLLLNIFAKALWAQGYLQSETTHNISNKAEMGYLAEVETDDAAKEIRLYFVTKNKKKLIKVEEYVFDYDLNFKSSEKQEYDKPDQVKSKYQWFNFKNKEVETFTGVTMEQDMFMKPVFKKKEVTKYWSWFNGRYKTSTKTLDKLKPRSEDGKYRVRCSFDNDNNGTVIAILGNQKSNKEFYQPYMDMVVMTVDSDLNVVSQEPLTFESTHQLVFSGTLDSNTGSEDLYEGDYIAVFASMKSQKKITSATPDTYYYVRISPEGKIKENIPFKTKAVEWRIEGAHEKNGVVTLYGPGSAVKSPSDALTKIGATGATKEKGFDNFQVVAFKDGDVRYITAPSIKEMESKTEKPDGQKKGKPYDGKRIRVTGLEAARNGDILIAAQDVNRNFKTSQNTYKDFLVMHFGADGAYKKTYAINTPAKGGIYNTTDPNMSPQYYVSSTDMFASTDENAIYWVTSLVTTIDKYKDESLNYLTGIKTVTTTFIPREQMLVSKIDLEAGTMETVQTLGDGASGKKEFFLRRDLRYVPMLGGSELLVIGEDRLSFGLFKGDNYIYLGKLGLK